MLSRIEIARHERGFLYRGRSYARFLRPGVHWVWGLGVTVLRTSTREAGVVALTDLDVYLRDPEVKDDLVVADLGDDERAIVWTDGRVTAVLGPGRHAFWSDLREVRLEVRPAAELRLEHRHLDTILAADGARRWLQEVVVPTGHRGLLYVDQAFEGELAPGRYVYWQGVARVHVRTVDVREGALDVAGQEILTKDRVSLRLNLVATYQVTHPRTAAERCPDLGAALYRELQLALREAVGGRTLDELLEAKDAVGAEVRQAVEPRAKTLGTELGSVGIKDVILPGDMKTLLNQVIEAEKRAQANLIARREETAATRSLLNTARLIESSPVLLRLKELEAAERIAGNVASIHVGGGLEGLVKQLLPPRAEA